MTKQKRLTMMRMISGAIFAAAATAIFSGYLLAQEQTAPHTIGVLEERGKAQCLKKWQSTASYLNRKIAGSGFRIISLGYDEVIPAVQNKSVEFVIVNPSLYVELETNYGAQAIATLESAAFEWGESTFGGVIFTLKSRTDIRRLKDIRGKKVAAANRQSFGGWIAVLRELKDVGVVPGKEGSSLKFVGTHDAVAYAVRDNTAEIGCVATSVLERMADEGKIDIGDFRIIHEHAEMWSKTFRDFPFLHSTRLYPQWPLAKTKGMDEQLCKEVANALFDMEPDQLAAVSGGYFGWTIPLNYQPVHDCLKELNLAPYRNYGKVTPMMAIRQYWIGLLFAGFIFLLLITGIMVAARLNQRLLSSQDRLKKEMLARQTISDSLINKEEQYRTLFESSRSPIMIIANNGDYLNANTAALEFLECGRDELLTKNMKEHIAPELMPEIVPDSSKAGEESKGVEAEYIVNGSSKALTLNSTPFVWEKKPAVILVGNDISTRRMTEKLLRESEEKFRRLTQELAQGQEATINILEDLQEAKEVLEASRENFLNIVENSTDGIAVVDHKNFILFLNAAATELFGQPAEILLGTRLHVLIDSREAKEVEIIAGQQTARTVEVKAVETQWEGEFAYLVLLHDITERKNAERALRLAAREWRTTFDAIGDGVAVLNRNATVMRCNKTLTGLLGKGFKDIIGCDAHALMHAGKIQQENEKCSIQAMFETSRREKRIMNIDSRWFSVVVDPLFDERKHLIGAVHIMRDITEQKKIENNLIEETKFIESIVETAQALIVVLSRDFGVIGVNTFCENTLGYKRDEIIGKPWIGHFVPLDYQEELKKILTNCLAGTKIKGHEIPVLTREGAEVFISWHSAELKNAAGENIGIVSMGYDITQRKEIEKVQRLAQLGTLVSHMAHEVNNPLMIISGRAQIALAEKIENKEVERDMQVIINECQRAKDIIQRLLRFSRPSKGEIKLVDINQALDEVISLVEHQFGLANVRLGKNYQAGLPQVLADERQLHEVFMNLLTNAKDAIENEGGIEITTTAENSQVIIRFRDSGAGMSKELISKVFDPFFTTKEKGTGLGLSICYSIIKTHGGELQFESEPGKGTTVTIVLPVEQETVN